MSVHRQANQIQLSKEEALQMFADIFVREMEVHEKPITTPVRLDAMIMKVLPNGDMVITHDPAWSNQT